MTFIMPNNPYFSLIFVNYHSAFELAAALKSLFSYEQHRDLFEVLVVNNDQSETRVLEELARQWGISVRHLSENSGFGTATNEGVRVARGVVIGCINPDTLWTKEILGGLKEYFEQQAEGCLLGLTLLDEQGQPEAWSKGEAPRLTRLVWQNMATFFVKQLPPKTIDWVSGGGLFVNRETWQTLRGFDERFFLYFEDVDLCVRAQDLGVAIVSEERFAITHRGGKSFSSPESQKKYFYASQQQYYKKHRPRWEYTVLKLMHHFVHREHL